MGPFDRWIPLLGLGLILIAVAGYHPRSLPTHRLLLVVHDALLVATVVAGIAAVLSKRLRPRLVHRLAFAALGIYFVRLPCEGLRYWSSASVFTHVATVGYILQLTGTPLMWGLALSRREDPTQERTQRFGRMAAGLVQLSFVFLFVSQIQELSLFNARDLTSGAALHALERIVRAADSILLLWASILCMRTTADPARIQGWAGRIHQLTFASFGAGLISLLLAAVASSGSTGADGEPLLISWIWTGVLVSALILLASFALPPCFRTPPGYNSSSPTS